MIFYDDQSHVQDRRIAVMVKDSTGQSLQDLLFNLRVAVLPCYGNCPLFLMSSVSSAEHLKTEQESFEPSIFHVLRLKFLFDMIPFLFFLSLALHGLLLTWHF